MAEQIPRDHSGRQYDPAARERAESSVAVAEPDEPIRIVQTECEVHEGFVDIYHSASNELVTVVEFVSPANKSNPKGRSLYCQKQEDLRRANINLIEIDLIRRGRHVLDIPEEVVQELQPWAYLVNLVRRGSGEHEVYTLQLKQRLPRIRVPLIAGDDDAVLILQDVFDRSYDLNPYPEHLNYESDPPAPELEPADLAWADELLKSKGLRQ